MNIDGLSSCACGSSEGDMLEPQIRVPSFVAAIPKLVENPKDAAPSPHIAKKKRRSIPSTPRDSMLLQPIFVDNTVHSNPKMPTFGIFC